MKKNLISKQELKERISSISKTFDHVTQGQSDLTSWIVDKLQFPKLDGLVYTLDDVGIDLDQDPGILYGHTTLLHVGIYKPIDFLHISPEFLEGDLRGMEIQPQHISTFMKKFYQVGGGHNICNEIIGQTIRNVFYDQCFPVYRMPQNLPPLRGLMR